MLPGRAPSPSAIRPGARATSCGATSWSTVFQALLEDFRARTQELVGLPPGETVEVDYVSDEPWAAFNYYQGGLRSRIEVNTDAPLAPFFVVELAAHEAYPGHHTEHAWKEQRRVREGGELEESAQMIGTPSALISEGIAGLAAEILLGDEEQEVTAAHVAGTSVAYDPDVSRVPCKRPSSRSGASAEMPRCSLHTRGASTEEAVEYLMRWGLDLAQARRAAIRFMTDPVWRSYVTTYTDGYDLCRDFVDGDPARFKRLLTEQLTPADLR